MLEIVNDVLKAEKDAEELVLGAKEKLQRQLSSFETDERDQLQRARSEAADRVALEIARIRQEAEDESRRLEKTIHDKADRFLEEHSDVLAEVSEAVKRLVLESPSTLSS